MTATTPTAPELNPALAREGTESAGSAATSQDAAGTAWHQALRREELDALLTMHDWRSWWSVAFNWAVIFAAMALVAWAPNPLTVIFALFVIGARQLGLAVFMHDAAHRALFRDKAVNDWVGNWLGAYPIWAATDSYRPYHLRHHAKNWTQEDPDLKLALPFPITRASLWRKVWRDLSGQTGLKFARFSLRRDLGLDRQPTSASHMMGRDPAERSTPESRRRLHGMLITNGVLLGLVTLAGYPALYLLWVGAWLTTYTLVTRIRSIAEHSMAPDPADPLRNTRTTLARWWERLLLAPNRVNYHLEHHLLMTVPHYHLPRFHALLRERGVLDGALVERGYFGILRNAASRAAR